MERHYHFSLESDKEVPSLTIIEDDEKSSASDTDEDSTPKDSSSFYKSKRAKPN